jgi:tetratricopeptide (TPR) repeat protein
MGYTKLGKLVIDNQRLSGYYSRVTTVKQTIFSAAWRTNSLRSLIASLTAMVPLIYSHSASAHPLNQFPGKGDYQQWTKASVIYNEGDDYLSQGNYDKAIAKFQSAIAIYPFDPGFWNNLALCLDKLDRPQEAEKASRHAIDLDPNDWHDWENLGNDLFDQNRFEDSKAAFLKCLKLNPPLDKQTEIREAIKNLIDPKLERIGQMKN